MESNEAQYLFTESELNALIADERAAEREACAQVSARYDATPWSHDPAASHVVDMVSTSIAAAIRARGQQ